MMHFASSLQAPGVADNIMLSPYLKISSDEGKLLEGWEIKLAYIQSLQRDRLEGPNFSTPALIELSLNMQKKGFGISNKFYLGNDPLSLYDKSDSAGEKYGERLYFSDPQFRIRPIDGLGFGFYDRLNLYYSYNFPSGLEFIVNFAFLFHNTGFSGSKQMVVLRYKMF